VDVNDMRSVIEPKADQLNADSLLGGPITITVTSVAIRPGTEQPVSIGYENDNGKPYKPCKSMCRVMVHCWGADANQYVGRGMTLYCDPKVKWGGLAVGGIRISHMTDINDTQVMALTETKGSKKPFTVKPLVERPATAPAAAGKEDPEDLNLANDIVNLFADAEDMKAHLELVDANQTQIAWLKQNASRLWKTKVEPAIKASYARNTPKAELAAEVENDPELAGDVETV
jgi:hypothetical protein